MSNLANWGFWCPSGRHLSEIRCGTDSIPLWVRREDEQAFLNAILDAEPVAH